MKLVVKQHRPVRKFLAISLTVIILVICGWLLVDYDQWQYIYARMKDNLRQSEVLKVNRQLDNNSSELRDRLVIAERSSQIDRLAFQETRKIISEQEAEIQALKEELEFFHQLMGNLGQSSGLVIQDLRLTKADSDHSQSFNLVLTHIRRDDSLARGKLSLELTGLTAGEQQRLGLKQLTSRGEEFIKFEFKHFTQLKGILDWPDDFEPAEVEVKIWLDNNPKKPHVKVFHWAELINE